MDIFDSAHQFKTIEKRYLTLLRNDSTGQTEGMAEVGIAAGDHAANQGPIVFVIQKTNDWRGYRGTRVAITVGRYNENIGFFNLQGRVASVQWNPVCR